MYTEVVNTPSISVAPLTDWIDASVVVTPADSRLQACTIMFAVPLGDHYEIKKALQADIFHAYRQLFAQETKPSLTGRVRARWYRGTKVLGTKAVAGDIAISELIALTDKIIFSTQVSYVEE